MYLPSDQAVALSSPLNNNVKYRLAFICDAN